jgi:hypothetical protein
MRRRTTRSNHVVNRRLLDKGDEGMRSFYQRAAAEGVLFCWG